VARGVGDALRVVARAGRDDSSRPLRGVEMRDAVVGAADLVGEDGLQVLALEQTAWPSRRDRRAAGSSGVSRATS
jgi:hypothetical protein